MAETLNGLRWLVTWRARRVDPREKPLELGGLSRELLTSRDKDAWRLSRRLPLPLGVSVVTMITGVEMTRVADRKSVV